MRGRSIPFSKLDAISAPESKIASPSMNSWKVLILLDSPTPANLLPNVTEALRGLDDDEKFQLATNIMDPEVGSERNIPPF